jgi:hypothetical protein
MRALIVALTLATAACAGPSATSSPGPAAKPDTSAGGSQPFKPSAVREPAIFVRVEIGAGQFSPRQVASLPAEYEGVLAEALNARAIPAKDVRLVSARDRIDAKAALARAREVGADHALLVEARVQQGETVFCRDGRRPFRAATTTWTQRLVVLRVTDGTRAFETANPVEVAAIDPDCDAPRDSRRRSPADHMSAAIDALLAKLLGS